MVNVLPDKICPDKICSDKILLDKIFIEEIFLKEIQTTIKRSYPRAIVWAYGSRVGGNAHQGSDLDLAVKDFGQSNASLSELIEALKDSSVPFLIDVLEFDRLPEPFKLEILKKYVVIYNGQVNSK